MTRWENYLSTAEEIILVYDGEVPLHHFLKGFFKQRPYMGSRDRRWVSQLVYHYYRLGHLWKDERAVPERILKGTFLCESENNELLQFFRPEWNEKIILSLAEKLSILSFDGDVKDIFPLLSLLSEDIDATKFAYSFFTQPYLFIRTRNKKQAAIIKLLEAANITFTAVSNESIALLNSTKIDTIITDKSWYEIQDLSSQKVGDLFHAKAGETWWDCCAASGGKSIMLMDKEPGVKLLVSDVRSSILQNLHQRFKEANIRSYEDVILDLTSPVTNSPVATRKFDQIILDAPCTGSGTWGRSPENLYYFDEESIATYQDLQKRIAENVVQLLKPGGSLIYITCSVFKKENEEVVQYIEEKTGLKKEEGGVIKGYDEKADSMFAVRLIKATT
ncbi:16S rRNA (cytosine967-C5)-methyltransferase [Chitinophaga sp. YR573]|uniref:RsmB/NOP family class I SAM-dependent RNA methyltransferase n=1 Tax=Chitinophaga sp. YR573 TaxID=1881040 RepID=UPI0008C550D9|nr:RsmB/NOP family class I SAM-dependent RNA methyltransferase [Chitinophaga sp. YR573]SEV97220.1 16S rRNA (cytosine967-C5)-methyltransferase [Chitinophaga sp. YR573]